jgi:sugar-specific transcriptional regulator TrmB
MFAADEKEEIRIVTGKFATEVYNALVPDITSALDRGCRVRAIMLASEADISSRPFFEAVRDHRNGTVISFGVSTDAMRHFFIAGNAFRVEVDDKLMKAYASFNDEDGFITDALRTKFDRLWEEKARR